MAEKKNTGLESLVQASLVPKEQLLEVKSKNRSFFIGLPKEISLQENRISLTPDAVALLVNNGHEVWVETHAGVGAKFSDRQFADAGAHIAYSPDEVYKADIILKVEPPTVEEIEHFRPGQALISAIQLGHLKTEFLQALLKKKVTAFAFEFIEDKVGGMPIVRAMSEIAGCMVMGIAAQYLSTSNGGMGVITGGITGVPPTKVVIIGAGTVAEHAARAALGLGAEVKIFDNHLYKLRRIKHLLGHQVYTSTIDTLTLSETLRSADVVIGALRPEKRGARHVVSEEMVSRMKTGSLIIDLAIDQGGCIETSEITSLNKPVFKKHGVIHYGVPNINSLVANTASTALSNILTPTILRAAEEGGVEDMIFSHKWFMKGVYTYKGGLTNEFLAGKFGLKYKNIELLIAARL